MTEPQQDETEFDSRILQEAERNEDGYLIWEREFESQSGTSTTVECNATHLFQPGERQTGSVDILVTEARLADNGEHGGNPAKPADGDILKTAMAKMEQEGLRPAWEVVEESEFP